MPKKKILIVDDSDQIREIYVDVFRKNGFEVVEAKDGVEGADKATSEDDLAAIFTGVVMPRMDGFQMLEILKKNALLSSIPVFINSHLGREEDRRKAESMGLDGFFIRGTISPTEICQKVKDRLNQNQGKKYLLSLNPWEMGGESFIEENGFPPGLKCDNCGTGLAIELEASEKKITKAQIKCPNCDKRY